MKGEKPDLGTTVLADEKVTAKSAAPKKKKKVTPPVATLESSSVAIKAKPEKTEQTIAKPKVTKAPKVETLKTPKEPKLKASKDDKPKTPKIAKMKAPKEDKLKAPKDDKLTKFMVSMKKSVRKSIKKEAADVGVSMNEYIVLAVVEKLKKNSLNATQ